ncbi:37S ribosomal protein S28, mitochondrial [Desmophyllum pertusum]|uniref:37S ribosomal protein S28, mitochondrial n=1 Tax=Desmophyllum pertusum TaxID=174260 RepID=A0A9W9YL62_9CNID|nr:37S ribosomal protein S28, mitochondrial [Desmophyllum pertusum]
MLSYLYHNRPILPTLTRVRTCFNAPGTSEDESFEEMFRNSRFVKMGHRPEGKTVVGRITHIVENEVNRDLYVDFGWKFHAVCTQGRLQGSEYKVDDLVRLRLTKLEAAGHFLGQTRHITLCEADATIRGMLTARNYSVMEK